MISCIYQCFIPDATMSDARGGQGDRAESLVSTIFSDILDLNRFYYIIIIIKSQRSSIMALFDRLYRP